MPRDLRASENQKRSKARRTHALARLDLRQPSVPRQPAAGPTSHAVKVVDPAAQAAIDAFMEKRNGR
jgi:hypothetical protein